MSSSSRFVQPLEGVQMVELRAAFDEDQERDERGRWTDGGSASINTVFEGDSSPEGVSDLTLNKLEAIGKAMADPGDHVNVLIDGEEGGDLLSVIITTENQDRTIEMAVENGSVGHWNIVEFQDTATPKQARQTLAATLDAMDALDVDTLELDAGLSDGGYLWARLGFEATEPDNLFERVSDRLEGKQRSPRSRSTATSLTEEEAESVRQVLAEYSTREADDEGRWLPQRLADVPGGKKILRGTEWKASLNLRKEGALDRMNKFLGRKKGAAVLPRAAAEDTTPLLERLILGDDVL